ncbi:hypothetical protein M433DRAFT_141607 [Acidomyces richmondensis BFW]|nr:MAG: hypothetical protein FE78DRAFT_83367 [Acidomyces sp. 'richmondensis']KYG47833.1 hypothetical protein M433DRAFT_141607 [Acidomyces richmondensis BFW]
MALPRLAASQSPPLFCPSLTPGKHLDTHRGSIPHDAILGLRPRDLVSARFADPARTTPPAQFRVRPASLEDYVRRTRRLVTPLYPQDAQVVVGLLDLHVDVPRWGEEATERIEILEAGTGHGALTLYLARAVHAANPPMPPDLSIEGEEDHAAWPEWKSRRRAVIHSVDRSARHSSHASHIVRGFRRGIYHPHVDFHVADISTWLQERAGRGEFATHAFLDLPDAENHLEAVTAALRVDAPLVVFQPSVTQVLGCVRRVRTGGLGLEMERVVELGVNGGCGGREWDVRVVKPKAMSTTAACVVEGSATDELEEADGEVVQSREMERSGNKKEGDEGWKMVCRPKVGELVVGGGFLAVFRKQRR